MHKLAWQYGVTSEALGCKILFFVMLYTMSDGCYIYEYLIIMAKNSKFFVLFATIDSF